MSTVPTTVVDLIVIGAGFAGLSGAYHAALGGKLVLVLDAGVGIEGASYASTAEMNHDPDVDWERLIETVGIDKARSLWALTELGISRIQDFAKSGRDHFEAVRVPAHLFTYTNEGRSVLEHKYTQYTNLGARVEYHPDGASLHKNFKSALTLQNEGRTNNQALLKKLARAVRALGGRVRRRVRVSALITTPQGVDVVLESGDVYKARHVLVATGGVPAFGDQQFKITPTRTFVTRYHAVQLSPLFSRSLLWDVAEPFHYIRSFRGNQLWVGGQDIPESEYTPAIDSANMHALSEYARSVLALNDTYTVSGGWSGVFYPTERTLPYIGTTADGLVSYSLGFGGSGLVMSFVSGYLHAAWAEGRLKEYQDLFAL